MQVSELRSDKWASHAVRLRVLRRALFHEKQSAFAKRLGIENQRYSNIENGSALSIDVARKIKFAAPGLTLDWLYDGEERALPTEMLTQLRAEAVKPEHQLPSSFT